ncbi:hypothetical protein BOTCAL_3082g00010 [Botryotinia calthae]|uniref:DUF6589 domain-containing protein n=1 Tax=Botryotinia calthae TaxID=38488 RepID=A0A4Y8C6Q9_9HELO|nr:hypothetical protein BOTCAL_3082g00010 [Botryotinia calthae]
MTPVEFLKVVEMVRQKAFTQEGWDGGKGVDSNYTTMCRLLQEIEIYMTINKAVKYGDIGVMRRMVDPLILLFWGAGQVKYGREMLYYKWLLTPHVCSPELQHGILASSLVNWLGELWTHKAIDLMQEHMNLGCQIDMQCHKNSTHDIDKIFDRVCLTNTSQRIIRKMVEDAFGETMSGAHTTRSTEKDILSLATRLARDNRADPKLIGSGKGVYLSEDLWENGGNILETKFNMNSSSLIWFGTQSI